jgi:hypothetical protein
LPFLTVPRINKKKRRNKEFQIEKDEDDSVVDLDLEDDSELCDTLDENSMERVFEEMLVLDTMDFDEELNSE